MATLSVDILCVYDPDFEDCAKNFNSESVKSGAVSAIYKVNSMNDLKSAVDSFSQIKYFEVMLHGMPGMINFANKSAMVGSYLNTLCTNPNFLQKNARILFDNCSIGAGAIGDNFMDSIGAGLLKGKGGIVGASTTDTLFVSVRGTDITFGPFIKPLSFGRLKVKRYDETGLEIGSQKVDRHGILR